MKIEQISVGDDLYNQVVELRYSLFFKQHGLPKSIIHDKKENSSTHVVLRSGDRVIAYGRLSCVSHACYQISQMVVDSGYQRQGYGASLLEELVQIAISKKADFLTLNSRITAVGLYKKLGFEPQGDVFNSDTTGVPHINMVYRIRV